MEPPDVVAFAESVDHVSQVARLCNDNGVPLIPFGSGTGLEGGINAIQVISDNNYHKWFFFCKITLWKRESQKECCYNVDRCCCCCRRCVTHCS